MQIGRDLRYEGRHSRVIPAIARDRKISRVKHGDADAAAADWAERTIGVLRERSPLSMAVSLEVVVRSEGSMADCLRRDLDLTRSTFAQGDVIEGIRARLVDKDDVPRWRVARIEDLRTEDVERMFESPWDAARHPLADLAG